MTITLKILQLEFKISQMCPRGAEGNDAILNGYNITITFISIIFIKLNSINKSY